MLAARATGMGWREATALGVLLNTRGLVELVILGAGLELGVLTAPVYSMMVLMALVTTAMATPVLQALAALSPPRRATTQGGSRMAFSTAGQAFDPGAMTSKWPAPSTAASRRVVSLRARGGHVDLGQADGDDAVRAPVDDLLPHAQRKEREGRGRRVALGPQLRRPAEEARGRVPAHPIARRLASRSGDGREPHDAAERQRRRSPAADPPRAGAPGPASQRARCPPAEWPTVTTRPRSSAMGGRDLAEMVRAARARPRTCPAIRRPGRRGGGTRGTRRRGPSAPPPRRRAGCGLHRTRLPAAAVKDDGDGMRPGSARHPELAELFGAPSRRRSARRRARLPASAPPGRRRPAHARRARRRRARPA